MLRFAFLLCCALSTSCVLSGGGIGEVDKSCSAGESCECSGIGACTLTCEGPDCDMRCAGTGECNAHCPDGGCTVRAAGQGEATLHCEGGGCLFHCEGTGACVLASCTAGDCTQICGGIGSCSNTCDADNCEESEA